MQTIHRMIHQFLRLLLCSKLLVKFIYFPVDILMHLAAGHAAEVTVRSTLNSLKLIIHLEPSFVQFVLFIATNTLN